MDITRSDKINSPVAELNDLNKIKIKSGKDKKFNLEEALSEHCQKYEYLGYRDPFSKGYSKRFFRDRLLKLKPIKKPPAKVYNINFNQKEIKYIELMKELVYFRNYRADKLYEVLYHLEPLWKKIANKYQLRSTDLGYYSLAEGQNLFKNGKRVQLSILDKRKRGYGFIMINGRIKFFVGRELNKYKKIYTTPKKANTKISGFTACKGRIIGRVKVVLNSKAQSKVRKGDVMVACMTTPDFLPCMEKAAAFITDEGGITCHAAIVAREMNKPCIIGTKFATKVLKDGDLVEVDANQGIIKIL